MSPETTQPLLLLVDDEPMNLILLERVFSRDYRLLTATGGQQALELIAQEPIDCALIDIMMPGMSGLQVLRSVRETPQTAELPVILVSALSDREDVVQGLKLGANDYVTKPIEMDILYARVNTQVQLKLLQDQRKQAIEELQKAHRMKDRILRIASHDLKSPLANISMIKYLLREAVTDNEYALDLVDMLDTTADHMLAVIRDFLETAAMQSGEVDLVIAVVPVLDVVSEVCDQYRLIIEKKQVDVIFGALSGEVLADRTRVSQILDNIIGNALKYSPPDSTVTVWAEARGPNMRISVADEGPGIAPEERSRLFTEFGRTSNQPTSGETSTGLGLWIVRQLVTLHGGQVGHEPASGGGSIFWVELPLAQNSLQPADLAQPR